MNLILFLILALFWSGSFIFIKISVLSLTPILSAFLRVLVAQIALSLFFIIRRSPLKVPFCSLWRLWVIGIFLQGIPFLLLFIGECYITPALAGIINGTVAIWVALFSILLFRDFSQVTPLKIAGLSLGIIGILFIFAPMIDAHNHNSLWGVIAVTGMAMSYAFGALLGQRFSKCKHKVNIQASLFHQHWSSLTFLGLMTLLFEPHFNITPLFHKPSVLFSLLYLGIFSTAIAWFIYNHLITTWNAMRASSVMYIVPILTLIWDIIFFHLMPTVSEVIGVVVILLGVALIQLSKKNTL